MHEHGMHGHRGEQAEHEHEQHQGHGKPGLHLDFSDVERYAKRFDGPDRDAWQKPKEVVDVIGLAAGHTVADVGAGTGYFLPYLSERVGASGRVLALDVEPNMVEYMKRRTTEAGWTNVEARVVAMDTPGLPDASVDRILIVNTWHHIDDRVEYGKKLKQALKPGGILAIVDFTLESETGPPPSHRLSEADVSKELLAAGFHTGVVEETLPDQYVVLGLLF